MSGYIKKFRLLLNPHDNNRIKTLTNNMAPNLSKDSKSIILTTAIFSKIESYIQNETFPTTADILHTAIPEFFGKISVIENIENFDIEYLTAYFSEAIELEKKDKSGSKKVTIAFNNYTLNELHSLTEATKLTRSYLTRIALLDFFIKLDNPHQTKKNPPTKNNLPQTKEELEDFIIKTFKKIDQHE
jgi:hypothetical protein